MTYTPRSHPFPSILFLLRYQLWSRSPFRFSNKHSNHFVTSFADFTPIFVLPIRWLSIILLLNSFLTAPILLSVVWQSINLFRITAVFSLFCLWVYSASNTPIATSLRLCPPNWCSVSVAIFGTVWEQLEWLRGRSICIGVWKNDWTNEKIGIRVGA